MAEVSHPTVIATFRLAIGEATRSPEIAQALEAAGRNPSRDALTDLFASAQSARVIDSAGTIALGTASTAVLLCSAVIHVVHDLVGFTPTTA